MEKNEEEIKIDEFYDLSENTLSGIFKSVFKGRGMEVVEPALYSQGMDLGQIDYIRTESKQGFIRINGKINWAYTLFLGQIFIKNFQEERDFNVFLTTNVNSETFFQSTLLYEIYKNLGFEILKIASGNNFATGYFLPIDHNPYYSKPVNRPSQPYLYMSDLYDKYISKNNKCEQFSQFMPLISQLKFRSAIFCFISNLPFADNNSKQDKKIYESYFEDILNIKDRHVIFLIILEDPNVLIYNLAKRIFKDEFTTSIYPYFNKNNNINIKVKKPILSRKNELLIKNEITKRKKIILNLINDYDLNYIFPDELNPSVIIEEFGEMLENYYRR